MVVRWGTGAFFGLDGLGVGEGAGVVSCGWPGVEGRRGIGGDCRGVGCGVVVRVRDGGDVELDV